MNRHTRASAALAELCSLGLPAELLVPAVLEALHDVVPSSRNLFDWTDEQGRLLHYFVEGPIDTGIAQLYFDEFHNRLEAEAMPPFAALPVRAGGVHSARALDTPRFFASALYAEIWRPQGLKYRVEAVLRGRQGQLLGSLVLYRGPGEPCFSADDERRLAAVLPAVTQALEACPPPLSDDDRLWVPAPGPAATLTLDTQGRLLHASPGALRLLMLADGGISPAALRDGPAWAGRDLLWQLQQRLHEHTRLARQPGLPRPDDVRLVHHNRWGRFVLQAQPLSPLTSHAQPLVLATVQVCEPHAVALERALRQLDLTPGQHRVSRALLAGHTQDVIARQLGVATSSVADQVRKLYARLGLRSTAELQACVQQRLVAPPPPDLSHPAR